MIKSELQIGNYVDYKKKHCSILELKSEFLTLKSIKSDDVYEVSYQEISPIGISDKIFSEMFKFERLKKKVKFVGSELVDYWEKPYGDVDSLGIRPVFTIWSDRKVSYFSLKTILKPTDRKFTHIHELQQLFKLHTAKDLVYENK